MMIRVTLLARLMGKAYGTDRKMTTRQQQQANATFRTKRCGASKPISDFFHVQAKRRIEVPFPHTKTRLSEVAFADVVVSLDRQRCSRIECASLVHIRCRPSSHYDAELHPRQTTDTKQQ
jgi:hypothetical protein